MKVAFFHGLESKPRGEKNLRLEETFDFVYAPPMPYEREGLFDEVLEYVRKNEIDLLIGSSMGGWFAYNISTITGIPTLLFNPAVHSRSIEPLFRIGNQESKHTVIFGTSDDIINPKKTRNWISEKGIGKFEFHEEEMGHRIPIEIFSKWIKHSKEKLEKSINEATIL